MQTALKCPGRPENRAAAGVKGCAEDGLERIVQSNLVYNSEMWIRFAGQAAQFDCSAAAHGDIGAGKFGENMAKGV